MATKRVTLKSMKRSKICGPANSRHQQRQHDQDRAACLHASQVDAEDRHSERLKILPVMPWGRSRSNTTATMSKPTPPRTGVNS